MDVKNISTNQKNNCYDIYCYLAIILLKFSIGELLFDCQAAFDLVAQSLQTLRTADVSSGL